MSFAEAWPNIADIRVEVTEQFYGAQKYVFTAQTYRRYVVVSCSNPVCNRGGVNLQNIVNDLVRAHQTEFDGSTMCPGNEASPNGKRVDQKCTNFFDVHIVIAYKDDKR